MIKYRLFFGLSVLALICASSQASVQPEDELVVHPEVTCKRVSFGLPELDTKMFRSVAEKLVSADKVCKDTYSAFKQAKCKFSGNPGMNAPLVSRVTGIPTIPVYVKPGSYDRRISECSGELSHIKSARVTLTFHPLAAGKPATDECSIEEYTPPNFKRSITRTVTKLDPEDYSKKKKYNVQDIFELKNNIPHEKLISFTGDTIDCYGGSFDPEHRTEVQYEYCEFKGKKIAVPRNDQLAVIANGRYSVENALKLPPPIVIKTIDPGSTDPNPIDPKQIIPTKKK